MALSFSLQDRQALAEAERHLDSANRCLVRQLRALSRFGRHAPDVSLAEALLRTMMETHQLMLQSQQALEALREGLPNRSIGTRGSRLNYKACFRRPVRTQIRNYITAQVEEVAIEVID